MGDLPMSKKKTLLLYIVLILLAFFMLFPLVFTVALSFSDNVDIVNGNYWPHILHFENYIEAMEKANLVYYMKNSIVVAGLTTLLQVLLALLAAYAVVFIPFKMNDLVFGIFMAGMMIPVDVLVISNFQTIRKMGMLNSYAGIILPSLVSAFGIFLMRQNMKQIPLELQEAGDVAGVGKTFFFFRVVVPLVKNSITTLAVYCFLVSWNSYLWPLIVTTEDSHRTIQIGLRQMASSDTQTDFRLIAAATIIITLPTLILIFFGQNRLQEGLTKGALK